MQYSLSPSQPMDQDAEKLKQFLQNHQAQAEHLQFEQSCHSVEDAAKAAQATVHQFVKNICLVDAQSNLIVAIARGQDRVSTTRVAKALGFEQVRLATPDEILAKTGYPCGGTPSFGFEATFLIDPSVMMLDTVYTGGGSEYSLTKISVQELQRLNGGQVVRVRK